MIINEMFNRGSEKEIRDTINNLEVIGCIDKFASYLGRYDESDNSGAIDKFERTYMGRLLDNVSTLICNIYMKSCENLSKEDLLRKISSWYVDGVYGVEDRVSNNGERDVLEDEFNDAEAYDTIKAYMIDTLDKLVEQSLLTEKDKKIRDAEYYISNCKETLERANRELEYNTNLLKELKGDK